MPRSLQPTASRVDRLLQDIVHRERFEQMVEEMGQWSNAELEWACISEMEILAGATVSAFDSPDAFVDAFQRRAPDLCDPVGLAMARAHWDREHWLHVHGRHGTSQVVVPRNSVHPVHVGWFGPGIVVVCPCGVRLAILREFIPPGFEDLPQHAVAMEHDYCGD